MMVFPWQKNLLIQGHTGFQAPIDLDWFLFDPWKTMESKFQTHSPKWWFFMGFTMVESVKNHLKHIQDEQ